MNFSKGRRTTVAWALALAGSAAARPVQAQAGPERAGAESFVPRAAAESVGPGATSVGRPGASVIAHPDAAASGSVQFGSSRADSPEWTFHLTPYLWAAGVDGRVGVRGRTADVDVGFRDLLEHLDGALMLRGSAYRGSLGAAAEVLYIRLSGQRATPGQLFTDAEFGSKQLMLELNGRYRFLPGKRVAAELLAGGRYWRLSNSLDLTAGALPRQEFSRTESWFDPLVGIATDVRLHPRWLLQAAGDIGGFDVGSELTWQLIGAVGYRFSDLLDAKIGYRYLDVDFDDEDFLFDVAMAGFIVGFTFNLPD